MTVEDVSIASGGDTRKGFNTAVDEFCAQANGQVIPAAGYLSLATEVYVNGGKDPAKYGVIGYVNCGSSLPRKSRSLSALTTDI